MNTDRVSLSAIDVTVGYSGQPIVTGINFTLQPGQMLAVVGSNGSGKSTLLKTLAGLIRPISGKTEVLGRAPGSAPDRIAYMRQHHAVNESLPICVNDIVRMGRYPHLGLTKRFRPEDKDLVTRTLASVGIDSLANTPLRELSGGQKQRVYLAQALVHQPDLYLLDETTAGIDATGRKLYLDLLEKERERGASIVAATHDFGEAERADLVLLLARRVVASGPPSEVFTRKNLMATFGVTVTEIGDGSFAHDLHHDHS